ncbi:putative bifunctional diguanylate cyclase/phosphodiesterase [Propylenella binzhouense]|nr:EAL domain-containing protein [Propylenella binzhouense]
MSVRSNRRAVIDAIVIFGMAMAVRVVTLNLDLFERFHTYSRQHEDWQLDELAVTVAIMSVALLAFGLRRLSDQRSELGLRQAAEERAQKLALHDPLTGLANRRKFESELVRLMQKDGEHAVFMLDLNGFKAVNDLYGHAVGDDILVAMAKRLSNAVKADTVVARLGGDEFAVLVPELSGEAGAARIAERLKRAFEEPVRADNIEHYLGGGIGIALVPRDGRTAGEVLRRADVALYRAKEENKASYRFYDEGLDAFMAERARLERDLRKALAEGRIEPHYQPVVDLNTGEITRFEALARWQHPELGDIPPARFIPVAEHRGLIVDLTEQILRRACTDALAWPAQVRLSFNLSPVLLRDQAVGLRLIKILAETGLPPNRLEAEITERALIGDLTAAKSFLAALRGAGVRISLDDFGTGYTTLSHLQTFPFDEIKIDRAFVQSMATNKDSAAIVQAILSLGRGLGLTVTAEGIEEPQQRSALLAEGCSLGQGFLFGAAVAADEAAALVGAAAPAAASA